MEAREIIEKIQDLEYNGFGLGCGLEDIGITDRYEAMRYGYDQAMREVLELLNNL